MKEADAPVFFGEWLQRRRKELDLTQSELAQRAGCSISALRKIESGERRPSKQLADLLAASLEIPTEARDIFIRVARGEAPVERLPQPSKAHAASPAPASPHAVPPLTNLPVRLTPLVGREPELAALGQLMQDPHCRLLTIAGPGGIGKTRLAIEAAFQQQRLFPDGSYFVPLAPLKSSSYLVSTIADALGFTFQGQTEPHGQLLNHLQARQALLLLDNVEHLLEGVGLFTDILEHALKVKLIVTSREKLNLQAEWLFTIQGLPVPPLEQVEQAEAYGSVALFVQNARRVQVGFTLQSEERAAVARICRAVEGMPLGIELAAAWVAALTCEAIADEIEQSLDFLASSMRDIPERQRSLRAAFDHSWSLLSADERNVLCRLAVFRGGFEREAAEQVAGATLPALLTLVSKSLVRRDESGRFDLHEVIRQYALSYFAEDPQGDSIRDRHSNYYLAMLKNREKDLKGTAQAEAIRQLADEVGNVRAAWDWAVSRESFAAVGRALRSFGRLHELMGWHLEGIEELELVVQALQARAENEEQNAALGLAMTQQGLLYFRKGLFQRALISLEESLTVLRPLDNPALLPDSLVFGAIILHLNGQIEESQSWLAEGLACAQAAGDHWFEAYALLNQGYVASLLGQHANGYEQMLAGLALWRTLGDPHSISLGLNFISPTVIKLGHYEEAQAYLQESLALCGQVGDRWGMGTAYRFLGLVALAQGDATKAKSLIRKSLDLFSGFVTGWDIVRSLSYLAEATAMGGDAAEARQIYLNALELAVEARATPLALDVLCGLAELQLQAGEVEEAMRLACFVINDLASAYDTKVCAEDIRAQAETQLPDHQVDLAGEWAASHSLEAIADRLLAPPDKETGWRQRPI